MSNVGALIIMAVVVYYATQKYAVDSTVSTPQMCADAQDNGPKGCITWAAVEDMQRRIWKQGHGA